MWHTLRHRESELDGGTLAGDPRVVEPGAAAPGRSVVAVDERTELSDRMRALQDALDGLRTSATTTSSAKRMIDPLLELWGLATVVDRFAARPIEILLVAIVDRSVVTGAELSDCIAGVETVLRRMAAV